MNARPAEPGGAPARRALPSARARTWSNTRRTVSGPAQPSASRLSASVSTSAVPTTAASATLTAPAACAGVRMPKPIAMGRAVAWRMRGTAAAKCSAEADRVPVIPAMLT